MCDDSDIPTPILEPINPTSITHTNEYPGDRNEYSDSYKKDSGDEDDAVE